ncbi:MAG TPA: HAD-IA family hydrolase [Coleofasciculaceae cyanobacterium]|jgi:HAD superfamily hydrolase (TIGR01549 family)
MSVKVIVFDFDGTLADTFDAIVKISNGLAREFGYKPADPEKLAQIRNLTSREIIKQSGISIFKIPFLLKKLKENLHNDIQNLSPIPGIKELLTQLKIEGHILGILTSNSEENVRLFLKNQEMQDFFSFIYAEPTLFSKHKILRKFIIQNQLDPEEVIYVGDETRDIEASKKIPVKVIAVTWGFNSGEALAKQNPDFLVHKPSELLDVMGSLQKIVF